MTTDLREDVQRDAEQVDNGVVEDVYHDSTKGDTHQAIGHSKADQQIHEEHNYDIT